MEDDWGRDYFEGSLGKLLRPHAEVTQICAIFSLSAQRYSCSTLLSHRFFVFHRHQIIVGLGFFSLGFFQSRILVGLGFF